MAIECVYSGRPLGEAIAHAREAVALLERTDDRFWLSQALFALSYSHYFAGEFDLALEAGASLDILGESMGSRRARTNAATMAGLSNGTRGDWEAGIRSCQRALELSPDPFETAFVLACLGKAHTEAGDLSRAIPALEEAITLGDQVGSWQYRQWFRIMLGDAGLLGGQTDRAR